MLTYLARCVAVPVAVAAAGALGSFAEAVYRHNYRLAVGNLDCCHTPNYELRWASRKRYVVEEVQRRIGTLGAVTVAVG